MKLNGWEVNNGAATTSGYIRNELGEQHPIMLSVSWNRNQERLVVRTLIQGQPHSMVQIDPPPGGDPSNLSLFAAANPASAFTQEIFQRGIMDPTRQKGTMQIASHQDGWIKAEIDTILSWPETPGKARILEAQEFIRNSIPKGLDLMTTIQNLRNEADIQGKPGSDAANLLEMQVNDIFGQWGCETLLTSIAQQGMDEKENLQAQIADCGNTRWTIGVSIEAPSPQGMETRISARGKPPADGQGLDNLGGTLQLFTRLLREPGWLGFCPALPRIRNSRVIVRESLEHKGLPGTIIAGTGMTRAPTTTREFPKGEAQTLRDLLVWHGAESAEWAPAQEEE